MRPAFDMAEGSDRLSKLVVSSLRLLYRAGSRFALLLVVFSFVIRRGIERLGQRCGGRCRWRIAQRPGTPLAPRLFPAQRGWPDGCGWPFFQIAVRLILLLSLFLLGEINLRVTGRGCFHPHQRGQNALNALLIVGFNFTGVFQVRRLQTAQAALGQQVAALIDNGHASAARPVTALEIRWVIATTRAVVKGTALQQVNGDGCGRFFLFADKHRRFGVPDVRARLTARDFQWYAPARLPGRADSSPAR